MHKLLSQLESAYDLHGMSVSQLQELGAEIREVLCNLLSDRSAHFASNLGVVELCMALHSVFDFRRDRLIWDTGHQVYPHKLITGRYHEFSSIRTKGGLMGYPNPTESEYDLFMTGHAGSSVSTMLGLRSGDDLLGESDRHAVAVIGDGAFPSGIVHEAMNNAGGLKKNLLVVLNDNKMSICPRVGGMASYLDRLRTNAFYTGLKTEVVNLLNRVPVFGDPAERFLAQLKEGVKAGLHGGMLFEELGFRYLGPIDGHNIPILRKYLQMVKTLRGPILLHVVTEKGHGFQPAAEDPVFFHTPPVFQRENGQAVTKSSSGGKAFTNYASEAIRDQMLRDSRITVMTAAMCQGNKLEVIRDEFPDRFFDTGICESHAVAFAAGQAKAGARPIVDIYSTFLQRSFDQIFQEVALQNLPVAFLLDRAGLTGPDGPTHHGVFDIGYLRIFPNMVVMAPGDALDLPAMLEFAIRYDGPTSIRYPKAAAERIDGHRAEVELGRAEVLREGNDGAILCFGSLLGNCLAAAEQLKEQGLDVGVINARFAKPLDICVIERSLADNKFLVTVEEGQLMGGFGSAVLEAVNAAGLDASRIVRLGIPDQFTEHGTREELLADLGLDIEGIAGKCLEVSGIGARETESETVR
ncbi:MAG: 1-deoxy-D-xylulose-5-phosphate synthase [Planctomycetaceae bacterium]|nr:1-deoxy-D-xylulose-5-phosphate synthase [Planctomycetales bacterium]MCB9926914.1 1-deoxy-D-xylulose-5-phosphate synthase [Planctomycetaceae bacterium]